MRSENDIVGSSEKEIRQEGNARGHLMEQGLLTQRDPLISTAGSVVGDPDEPICE
jgi:hypothetical protein